MVGEEESREMPEGMETGGLLKGFRGYRQWRADLHQTSEMTESDLLKVRGEGTFSQLQRHGKLLNLNESLEKRTHPSQERYWFSSFSWVLFLTL